MYAPSTYSAPSASSGYTYVPAASSASSYNPYGGAGVVYKGTIIANGEPFNHSLPLGCSNACGW